MSDKGQATRDRILDASVALFALKGYIGTSQRDIAEALDMSVAAIYHHFRSKESILLAVMERSSREMVEQLRAALQDETLPPLARVERLMREHLRAVRKIRVESAVYTIERDIVSPETYEAIRAAQRELLGIFQAELGRLEEAGVIPAGTRTLYAFNVLAIINWSIKWCRDDGPYPVEKVEEELVDFIMHGCLRDSAVAPSAATRAGGA